MSYGASALSQYKIIVDMTDKILDISHSSLIKKKKKKTRGCLLGMTIKRHQWPIVLWLWGFLFVASTRNGFRVERNRWEPLMFKTRRRRVHVRLMSTHDIFSPVQGRQTGADNGYKLKYKANLYGSS